MDNFLEHYQGQDNPVKEYAERKMWYKNPRIIFPLAVVLLATGIVYAGVGLYQGKGEVAGEKINEQIKTVKTIILDEGAVNSSEIKTAGVVKADTKVDVVALAGGTVRGLNFSVGQTVSAGQTLASLYDSAVLTNLNNAQISYNNSQNSLESVKRLTDETVSQAQIGVKNGEQQIEAAQTALKSAQDNLANAIDFQKKSIEDAKNNAVVTFYNHLNTVNNVLDQVNYIIKAEGNSQLPGISVTLSIRNPGALINSIESYKLTRDFYVQLSGREIKAADIENETQSLINLLAKAKNLVDGVISVLDYTESNSGFSDSSLLAQKNSFAGLRSQIVGAQTSAQAALQGLENIKLSNKRELDTLKNAVTGAENQLLLSRTGHDNTLSSLNSAKQNKEQQLISAKNAVDGASGQLNLARAQAGDLSLSAPIGGQITAKYVEVGAEVAPGQKIAEISRTDLVKIEAELTSEDVYKIKLGQTAMINGMFKGTVSHINPSADPVTKKVKIEIAFDNAGKELIPETFINVTLLLDGSNGAGLTAAGRFLVPLKAVAITQTEKYVFIVRDNKAVKTAVEVGSSVGDKVEIIYGLNNGDELIVEGNRGLEGGEELKIKN